jgi:hypothetical protein
MKAEILPVVLFLSVALAGCEPRQERRDVSGTNNRPTLTPGVPSATNFPAQTNQPDQVNQPGTHVPSARQ